MGIFAGLFGRGTGPWSERVRKTLELASRSDPNAVRPLVDLLYENPMPLTPPALEDEEVSKLLGYPGMSPEWEVKSVKLAVEYQTWIRNCIQLASQIRGALQTFPKCALKDEVLDLAIEAAGFELSISDSGSSHSHLPSRVCFLNVRASEGKSLKAVEELCKIAGPVTTNILHKVASKKDITVKTGTCLMFEEDVVDFSAEREMAKRELSNRGNVPYDPKAYFLL